MIVVDTSVWIDFFRGTRSAEAEEFAGLLESGQMIAITDVIAVEILQGIVSEKEAEHVALHLTSFPILRLDDMDGLQLAARLHRSARGAGKTVRKTVDCLIAAACIKAEATLLHNDADFDRLAEVSDLRIHPLSV